MKIRIIYLLLIGFVTSGFAQNDAGRIDKFAIYKSLNFGVGYSYNFGEPYHKAIHILNLEINKSIYGGLHGGGAQYGIGTEIGLNTEKFTIGPNIYGIFYFQGFGLGIELISYTDFDNWNLRFVPFFGMGNDKFRLTLNPQIILYNKNFQPVNEALLNITYNFTLDRKKRD